MYKRSVPVFDPTQAFGPVEKRSMAPKTRMVEKLASHFRSRPHEWIDGRELQRVGGEYAWRTRVSDCRRQLGMTIDNRQRKVKGKSISEYRYIPDESGTDFCLVREGEYASSREG